MPKYTEEDIDAFGEIESDQESVENTWVAAPPAPIFRGRSSSLPISMTCSELTSLPEEHSTSVFINIILIGQDAREVVEDLCRCKSCDPCIFTSSSPAHYPRKPQHSCLVRIHNITAQVCFWAVSTFQDSIPLCATVQNESTVHVFLVSIDKPIETQLEELDRRVAELRFHASNGRSGKSNRSLLNTFSCSLLGQEGSSGHNMKSVNAWFKKHYLKPLASGKGLMKVDEEALHACLSNEVVMQYCLNLGLGQTNSVLARLEDTFQTVRKHMPMPRMRRNSSSGLKRDDGVVVAFA